VIYDRTAAGLASAWWAGTRLYRALGRVSHTRGVASFADALDWLVHVEPDRAIAEVQLWSHGKWGDARLGSELFDERALLAGSALSTGLSELRARLAPEALLWFRTCETFGAERGQRFARALSDRMGARVAGHTFVIAVWQSGLHALAPGARPSWDPREGLAEGSPSRPIRALASSPSRPNTISCFDGRIPEAYVDYST
jgi:hypothetical protein